MIKRILNSKLPVIIYTPPGVFDHNWFTCAYQAGALPVFDTEFFKSNEILDILEKLKAEKILFGVRFFFHDKEIIDFLNHNNIINLDLVVLAYNDREDIRADRLTNTFYKVFVETREPGLGSALDKISPHAVIVKGCEAPGLVARETSFILMQWYLKQAEYPLFIHGGVGMHTTAGMFAAGAAGIVLDNQLFLTDECPLADNFRQLIGEIGEKDTLVLGGDLKNSYRVFARLGTKIVNTIKEKESVYMGTGGDLYGDIVNNITAVNRTDADPLQSLFYLGQDALFARHFVKASSKLNDVIHTLFLHTGECLEAVDEYDPLVAGAPLAREQGVVYPAIQGPMANVSDNADFAKQVLNNGVLPFLALGNLPPHLAEKMLADSSGQLPCFGAGLMGIEAVNKTIKEHIALIKKYHVKYALLAGGVPSQVNELEACGIRTYLHTPALSLLENAIAGKVTGFIFEGAESGGHIGNLTSLVLWEIAIEKIIQYDPGTREKFVMLFAGGIGTEFASFFISGMTAHLAKSGIRIGISTGTPYLFTKEIVETKAIKKLYQDILLEKKQTFVIGKTVGLPSRTVETQFSRKILENEYKRIRENIPLEKRKTLFEDENLGSLLTAAKAFKPVFNEKESTSGYIYFNDQEHFEKGNFAAGESLVYYSHPSTIKNIHDAFFVKKSLLFSHLNSLEIFSCRENQINDEIAVIGMGCLFPDAAHCDEFWQNIITKKYSITEAPADRFDQEMYYSADRNAEDKSYSRIAGVIRDYQFDYQKYGYSREEGESLSRSQQLILDAAMQAVEKAGYLNGKKLPGERTGVIIASCITNELYSNLNWKYFYPELKYYLQQSPAFNALADSQQELLLQRLKTEMSSGLNSKTPLDSILNIEAARIAKHLELSGISYCVDAACASSLVAIDSAVKSLLRGECDYVLAGGLNTNIAPETFIGFSKIQALSNHGSFPFDERADGFVLGEGAGMLLLKRAKDAIRDNDTILGIIKAIGGSSDGKGKAIAAPKSRGQELAIRRCYEKIQADFSCNDIQYIEAHGTSTSVGDATETESLTRVFTGTTPIGISSVKSQIGHLIGGAGIAGMIKLLLAIKHKTLPPNGLFDKLSSAISLKSPLYIIADACQWQVPDGVSRKAGISSYGFGGINYHCCVEEYTGFYRKRRRKIFTDPAYDFNDNRIVVVGMGCVLPGANNSTAFWNNLAASRQCLTGLPENRFHNAAYAAETDPLFRLPSVKSGVITDYVFNSIKYKIPPNLLSTIDKTQLYALDAADQAIAQAKLQGELIDGNQVAVILGNSMTGERSFENIVRVRLDRALKAIKETETINDAQKKEIIHDAAALIKARYPAINENTLPGFESNIISGRIANYFNCNGANFTVDSACTSSAIALSLAIKGLLCGDYEYAIAGGSHSNLTPIQLIAYNAFGMLSAGVNRVFDKTSDGVNPAEGAAVLILTTFKNARKLRLECFAEMQDFSFCSSGTAAERLLMPQHAQYEAAMAAFYKKAQILPRQINYLELFGIANINSDMAEYTAIQNRFSRDIFFGNVKPNIGYLFAANPAVAALKLVLMNYHRTILPNWPYSAASSLISANSVLKTTESLIKLEKKADFHMAMNFFSIGGNHAHGIIHNLPLWLTAFTSNREKLQVTEASFIRTAMENQSILKTETGKIAVLLSGQGSQAAGMLKDLYAYDETIHFIMDEGDKIFKQVRGYSLLDIIFNNEQLLNLTINTQPAIFLTSAAIYDSLRIKGLRPDYFIGHSLGEFTALYCAGILDFKEALKLVIKRSDIMHHTAISRPGSMVAIFDNAEQTRKLIQKSKLHYIYIANNNSGKQTVVSGENYKIELFIEFLKQENISFKKINASAAFHTPLFKAASRELADYLETIQFNNTDFSAVFSNVTGAQYPSNEKQIKKLLEKQMISTVEFVESIKNASRLGVEYFIEISPKQVLSKLVDNIDVSYIINLPAVYPMYGEIKSLNKLLKTLEDLNIIKSHKTVHERTGIDVIDKAYLNELHLDENDFSQFIAESREQVNNILYREYLEYKKRKDEKQYEKLGIYTGDIVISGAAVGLPGSKHSVFNRNNFDEIITGTNYIEALSFSEKRKILDKNITRLKKDAEGEAHFQEIKAIDDVIQLSGHLGYFDLKKEYGIEFDYDITYSLAIAAGFEALKDANIPLVMQYKQTTAGSFLEEGLALPPAMQERTGVIFASLFPGFESIINEISKYYKDKAMEESMRGLENFYSFLMENIVDPELTTKIKERYGRLTDQATGKPGYEFSRNLLFNIMSLGSAHFAQIIKAKGPNTQINSTCASTIQAISIAEDWLRADRCDRVIIIGSDAPTSGVLNEWISSSFLAIGAATNSKNVTEAAVPFDARRSGMILGSGAVSLIVEKKEEAGKRGMNGQAQVLGTYTGNSAYHASRINADHLADEMKHFLAKQEKLHNLKKDIYARALLFMSHEAYTHGRGGAAEAEIGALKSAFPKDYQNIVITNTKGYTGNTLGASIEDAVLVKSLQKQRAPAIANLKVIPEPFRDIKFSTGSVNHYEYGLHMAAGLGSQFAFLFIKRIEENLVQGNASYKKWLMSVTGQEEPQLKIKKHILQVEGIPVAPQDPGKKVLQPAAAQVPIARNIKEIIARQTGYAIDMLEENLDFEADLGIDTVKQVQIFGKVSSDFGLEVPDDLKLNKLNTITKLVHFVEQKIPGQPDNKHTGGNGDTVKQEIKKVITSQTGYASDMLDDNLDFEADLGIDTVKQVQIFGKLSANFGFEVPDDLKLSKMNTITRLEEYVKQKIQADSNHITMISAADVPMAEKKQAGFPIADKEENAPASPGIFRRYTIKLQETALPSKQMNIFKNRTFLISVDAYGFAQELINHIKQQEGKVLTIGCNASCDFLLELTGKTGLEEQVITIINALPHVHGFIHFLPLNYYFQENSLSDEAIRFSIEFCFLMAKGLYDKLHTKETLFSILSFNSIIFPYDASARDIHPHFAGLAGMLKTLKKELPDCLVKAVDFCLEKPLTDVKGVIRCYLQELMSCDPQVETGYRNGLRYILSFIPEDVKPGASAVKDGDTLLVVGGVRGITFEIIKALSKNYKIRFIILGRSEIADSNRNYGLDLNSELCDDVQKIMGFLKDKLKNARPLEIRKAADKIINARITLKNMQTLKAAGTEAEYHSADTQERKALTGIINKIKTIDGILFSAGIDESEFINKKSLASFNRVFYTKVLGILNLLNALESVNYRYLLAFSSVTAKLGNAAQADYTAANDMLGKIIQNEKIHHTDRIYKIFDWTAWEGTGMAAGESVHKILTEKGIKFLPIKAGMDFFINELHDQNTNEIIVTGENLDNNQAITSLPDSYKNLPFLDTLTVHEADRKVFSRILDLERDLFLKHHIRHEIPLFLGATGMEAMAEAAIALAGKEYTVSEIRDFSIPYGIKILQNKSREIFIESRKNTASPNDSVYNCRITSFYKTPDNMAKGESREHYQGKYFLKKIKGKVINKQHKITIPQYPGINYKGNLQDLLYHPERLFMGDLFVSIKEIFHFDNNSIAAKIHNTAQIPFFTDTHEYSFIMNPVLIDAAFQTCGVIELLTTDTVILPSKISYMKFYKLPVTDHEYICFSKKIRETADAIEYSIELVDIQGNIILFVENFSLVKVGKCPKEFSIVGKITVK